MSIKHTDVSVLITPYAILQCEHPGRIRVLFSGKHMTWFRVNSFAFGWWFNQMRGEFWSVKSEILIDKYA